MLDTKRLLDQFLGARPDTVRARPGRESDIDRLLGALGGGGDGVRGGILNGAGGGGLMGGFGGGLGGGLGKGALAAGLAGMLLKGGKKPRKMMGSAVKMGGLALVAGLAYRAWQDHRSGSGAAMGARDLAPPDDERFLPSSEAEAQDRARAVLTAMIAAAKADGHVDSDEQARLFDAVDALDLDADDKAFMLDELRAPLDIDAVARGADGPEAATELYVASLLVIEAPDVEERRYLDELGERLELPRGLVRRLEAEVAAAS